MLFMDELAYLRLYSAKRKVYIPIDPSDRKKGAAIVLLTKDSVDSHTLMNLPFIHNPNCYESLYIDRNVNALIKSGMIADEDLANEGEEPVNEAMMHVMAGKKIKVSIDMKVMNANDQRLASKAFDEKNFLKWYRFFKTKDRNICESVTIRVYPNIKELVRENQDKALADKDIIAYSYSGDDYISVVANSGYNEIKSKDGPSYEGYLLNELISFVCMRTSKRCSRYLAGQIATALSGRLTPELIEKIKDQWDSQKDYGLACAYVIKTMYDNDGQQAIVDLCKTGDINMLGKYAVKGFIRRISGIYEATLTSEQRKNMKDSEYGLPKLRKYPMPDESHVRSAIRFFNHVSSEDEAELARNIKKKIKQYGMSVDVGENNRFSKYYGGSKKKSSKNEFALLENAVDLSVITESVNISNDKIAVGCDFHFINYNDDKTKIILKPDSYMQAVVDRERKIVGNDGIFIFLGDLIYKAFDSEYNIPEGMREKVLKYANGFTGKYKIFIRGNHDNLPDEFYIKKCGFTHVCASLKYDNYIFTHQPVIVRDPKLNIHGHIHGTRIYTESQPRNYIDVYTLNSLHIGSLSEVVEAKEKYEKTIKQAPNVMKANPHQYVQGDNLDLDNIVNESAIFEVKFIDDKGNPVPKKCPSCGYKVGVFFRGEPVFLCTNRECNKYFGTVPFNESANNLPIDWVGYYPKQTVSYLQEATVYHSTPAPIPGSDAERNKHFDEVMEIVDALSQNERDDIAINGIYTDSPNVIDRRIARDSEGNPVGFIDVYFFRSKPFECQLTAAIKPEYRGQGYMHKMLADIIQTAPIGHPGVTKYVWNVDPNNIHSIKLATRCGFRKTGILRHRDDLDIDEDRYEYALPFKEAEGTIPLPQRLLTESFNADGYVLTDDYIMTEDFITFFNGMDTQVISEAEKKYDSKLKRYLYNERLKNNKAVLLRYQQMKAMNPIIKRTFLKLPMYRRRNIFIDLSFYHGLFLEHLQFKKDVAIKMYWDFLNRLIVDNEYKDLYKKITIFIPVWAEAWGTNTAEDLMDYRKSINPISMIIRMLRKNPTELKKWGNKDILFVSPQGYFKVNFNKFELKDLTKFRRFITKLVSNEIIEEDEDEDGYTTAVNADNNTDSASVIIAKIVDKLEKNTGVTIDDITGGPNNAYQPAEVEEVLKPSKEEFTHLRVRAGKIELPNNGIGKDGNQTKNPVKNAVLIMAPTGDESADSFLNNQIARNIISISKRGYFSP